MDDRIKELFCATGAPPSEPAVAPADAPPADAQDALQKRGGAPLGKQYAPKIGLRSSELSSRRKGRTQMSRKRRKQTTKDVQGAVNRRRFTRAKPVRERTAKGGYRHLPSDKPRQKPSKLQVWDRLDFVAHLMAQGVREHEIKKQFRAKFGGLSESCSRQYLACARQRLIRESNKPREAHLAEALAFCRAIRSDQIVSPRDRLKAQQVLNELLGLNARRDFERHENEGVPVIPIIVRNRDELAQATAAIHVHDLRFANNVALANEEGPTHNGAEVAADDQLDSEFRRLADAEAPDAAADTEVPGAPSNEIKDVASGF